MKATQIAEIRAQAQAGDATAQSKLGMAYREGNGVPKNDAQALNWFRKAAEQGDSEAETDLGVMYRMGEGVPRDKEEAVRWYRKAAKQGNAKAMFNLGASYYNGDGVDIDDIASYAWFLLAEEAGNPEAGEALSRGVTESRLLPGAAFEMIGEMFEKGDELPKNAAGALKWYRKAADGGSALAAVKVAGLLSAPGRTPTEQEYEELRHRCEGASKRYSPAAYCMALIYSVGIGVEKNPAESMKWLNRAAELGHPRAALDLGQAFWKGDGVRRDLVEAYMWIWLAHIYKAPGAEQVEPDLRKEMEAKDVELAKKKADAYARSHFVGLRQRSESLPPAQ